MPSVTGWTRLEPHPRSPAMTGFAARVGDPLWLLARQLQVGELTGEDAGSLTRVDLTVDTSPLSRYRPDGPGAAGEPLDVRLPLDAVAEAEQAEGPADDRAAAVAGADLLTRLGDLAAVALPGLVADHPLPEPSPATPPARRRRAELLRRRVPDGRTLRPVLAAARAAGDVSTALPGLDRTDAEALDRARAAAGAWLDAWPAGAAVAGTPSSAWRAERLGYRFSVAAAAAGGGEHVLVADDHPGGRLDWWSFDAAPGATLGASGDGPARKIEVAVLPTPVSGPGLPAPRFWAFELGDVNLDAVSAAPEDLARLLFIEFAVSSGGDYFAVPLRLDAGSVTTIRSLTATTTFGDTVTVPAGPVADALAGRPPLRLFDHAVRDDPAADPVSALLLPPAAVAPLAGTPVEELLLARDEMANVAWAVERTVPGIDGRAEERAEQLPHEPVPAEPGPRYQLVSEVPASWLPMLPSATDAAGADRPVLRLAGQPSGELLAPGAELHAERLTRSGVLLARLVRRARTVDGRTVLWMARRTRPGRGESSSGLRFDAITGERSGVDQ